MKFGRMPVNKSGAGRSA